jgi:hypothetical protein
LEGLLAAKGSKEMMEQERHDALQYLMFLKEMCCGTIKGHRCTDQRKQREYARKEETSLPIVAIKSLMLPCIINAKEERKVETANIANGHGRNHAYGVGGDYGRAIGQS